MPQDYAWNHTLSGAGSADAREKAMPAGQGALRWEDHCGLAAAWIGDEWAVWTQADEFGEGKDLCGLERGF